MNGVELAKKIREVNQDIQILFVTGYPDYINICMRNPDVLLISLVLYWSYYGKEN